MRQIAKDRLECDCWRRRSCYPNWYLLVEWRQIWSPPRCFYIGDQELSLNEIMITEGYACHTTVEQNRRTLKN